MFVVRADLVGGLVMMMSGMLRDMPTLIMMCVGGRSVWCCGRSTRSAVSPTPVWLWSNCMTA